ncbi:hypothetical protein Pst134EA_017357 [Puccinia striiformis f. sp. tritici]|uniref:hypothetical protein n=1 Tax=Puccinia striiformis f. sp. tritici TaxID=168172 RepID=UPI002008E358|nr:hypothetical protein Pst134EA_017357 [Puccinia striiformis f. sp. tritici]KAH9461048.1 hypothetical protein Pst134EA_017357 [Puccinia striiformis f. sp. tritici]
MKVVGLLSGGKDSCYNLCHCVKNGHEVVALATLGPEAGTDEIDSYMYQTVGQDGVHLVAEALRLPLYRQTITGTPLELGSEYGSRSCKGLMKGIEGDETEDMYNLLNQVKSIHPEITAVSVGAILSNYQRVRVEYVCHRLNLTVLAFLWQRDQAELLCEMVEAPVEAVLIKIAGIGLVPNHLGKSLGEMEPILNNLNSKYGAHVCGEGGEYETYTLDCPLFHSRISLEETAPTHHHESSSIAPVAYLRLQSAKLCPKPISVPNLDTVTVPPLFDPESIEAMGKAGLCQVQAHIVPTTPDQSLHNTPSRQSSVSAHDDWVIIASIFGSSSSMPSDEIEQTLEIEVEKVFDRLEVILAESSLTFMDIAHINLHLSSMAYFSEVNRDRVALHVQSRSYWAPANIGPYSQAVKVGSKIFVSGQIGLIPATLTFPMPSSFLEEAVLSLQHARRILATFPSPQWIESIVCYMTDMSYLDQARKVWEHTQSYDKDIPLLFLEVLELPKGALVEWQFIAGTNQNSGDRDDNESNSGPRYICGRQPAFYGCHSQPSKALTVTGTVTNDPIISIKLPPHHPTYIQGFYSSQITADEAERRIKASFNLKEENEVDCAMSLVRVSSIGLNTGPADLDIGFHMMGLLL